jgi:UDP-glucuronate decarboxylase
MDTIEGILLMLYSRRSFHVPVNIGNNNEYSIKYLAKRIIKLTNSKSRIINMKIPSADPKQRCSDIAYEYKELKFSPKIDIEDGLQSTTSGQAGCG